MQIQIRPPANEAPVGDFTSIGFGLSIQKQYGAAPSKVVQKRSSCKILNMNYFSVFCVMIKSLIEICEAELLLFDRRQKQNSGRKSWIDFKREIQGQILSLFSEYLQYAGLSFCRQAYL